MEELIRKITAKYYPADSIDSIKIAGGRAIITLVNATEDEAKTAALKAEAAAVDGIAKATVIFTAAKAFNGLRQEDEMWHIRGVKKIIAVASRQRRMMGNVNHRGAIWRLPCQTKTKKLLYLTLTFTVRPSRPCWAMRERPGNDRWQNL